MKLPEPGIYNPQTAAAEAGLLDAQVREFLSRSMKRREDHVIELPARDYDRAIAALDLMRYFTDFASQ